MLHLDNPGYVEYRDATMRELIMLPTTISESFLKTGTTDRLGCIVVQINTGLLNRTIVIDPVIEPLTYPFEVHIPIVIIYTRGRLWAM